MKQLFCFFVIAITLSANISIAQQPGYVLVIHGGAGHITPERITPDKKVLYEQKLEEALLTGEKILSNGGSALDAVVAAVQVMEECPLFNSGKGAVFNAEGKNELDASIMDGKTMKAGAVAGVMTIKSPIEAARRVMDSSAHVMMAGRGAEEFARVQGLEIVDPSYFYTEESWQEYLKVKARIEKDGRKGTVGAVALDMNGNLAAATSTGGMTYKKYGRIGDSPIIGAGTYANNESCAVSCTGHGEYFIRNSVAFDVSARMLYLGETVDQAAGYIINEKLKGQGGNAGLIALDKNGNISMPFNTTGMFRGYVKAGSKAVVLIFR